jgi:hypothetical protein
VADSLRPSSRLELRRVEAEATSTIAIYTQPTYTSMRALFVELPAFERHRSSYLDDEAFGDLQQELLERPDSGDVIPGTGGLRKVRFADARRGKGKRGGLRIIYFWWEQRSRFWLFAVYSKDEVEDLSQKEKRILKGMLEAELKARQ